MGKIVLWTGPEIAAAVNGQWISGKPETVSVTGVGYHPHRIQRGDLVFAVNPKTWGKRFKKYTVSLQEFLAAGAAVVIIDHKFLTAEHPPMLPLLLVEDTRKALESLGRAARARFGGTVICITGSVGKTSTREGLRLVLSRQASTYASAGNNNHSPGVPLSLAQTPGDFRYGVYEFSVDNPRRTLSKALIARPHVVIVTQIQPDHMNLYPTLEAIADQKSLLFDALEPDGVVILNRDEPLFERLLNNAKQRGVKRIMTFGEASGVDVQLIKCELKRDSSYVTAVANGKTIHYVVGAPGRHMVQNSLAVLAGVAAVGADVEQAAQALVSLEPLPYRTVRHRVAIPGGSFEIVDDTFNANAASIKAALEYASLIKPADSVGRRIAVLGELSALGGMSQQVHVSLAEPVMNARIDKLFTVGDGMKHLREMLPPEKLGSHVQAGSELVSELVHEIRPDDLVLVTGLRVWSRDEVEDLGHLVDALRAEDAYHQSVKKTMSQGNNRTIQVSSEKNQFSVVLVGDTSFGENYQVRYKEKGGKNLLEEKGYDYPLYKMKKFLCDANLAIANLATPLTNLKVSPFANKKNNVHWGDPEKTPQTLRKHNVHAVNLANNHTFDYGREGFEQTLAALEANRILYFGAGRDSQDAIVPLIAQILFGQRQVTLAIIGAFQERKSYRDQYGAYAQGSAGGVQSLNVSAIAKAIQGVKKDYPEAFIILFPHWGKNYQQKSSQGQTELAEALIDAGVDLIVGHGAHLMQDITKRNNQWTVYSLGNFMFNSPGRYAQMQALPFSLAAKLMIENQGETIYLRLYPIVTDNKLTAYQTRFVNRKEFEQVCGLIENQHLTEIIKDRDEYGYFLQLPLRGMSRNIVWFEDVHDMLVLSDDHKELLMKAVWDSFQQKKFLVDALPLPFKTDFLPRIVFISVSDGISPARVVSGAGHGITEALVKAFELLLSYNTVKWLKVDIVNKVHDLRHGPFVGGKNLYGAAGDTRSGAAFIPEQLLTGLLLDEEKHRFIFNTISLFTDGEQRYPLYRGHRTFNKLSCDLLLTAAKQAGHYLAEAVNSEGRFAYIYQPQRDRVPDKYNILRHAGSIYALLELYQVIKDEPLLTAAKRAIILLQRYIHYFDSVTGRAACVVEGGYTKLGGNALAILAFTKYMEVTQDLTLLSPAKDLAAWIQNTQLPTGNFSIHKQEFLKREVMPFVSEYYPGEAIFALTRLYPFDKEAAWLDVAEKGALYLITVRDRDVLEAALSHDHWFLYALNELYRFRPQPLYIEHALKIAEAIMQKQNSQPRYPDWLGSYYDPPRSTPAAVRSEGLCAAFQLAQHCGYTEQAERIRESVYSSVCFQLQTQIQPESAMYLKNPSRSLGGFRRSFDNFELRIDYSQHNISALLALYKIMLKDPPPQSSMETIFVQIASYRDPELPNTVRDCLNKCKYPERIRFGICWQYTEAHETDALRASFKDDPRFRFIFIHWKEARGVGWARSQCNQLFREEDFTLQIDSHSRFAQDWDVEMIEEWKRCNHPKAVLSGYPPGFTYDDKGQEILSTMSQRTMVVKGFDGGFIPTFKNGKISGNNSIDRPYRGSFVAAGYSFTVGKVCKEVPYVPEVYFTGEEILYSLRLFTYDYLVFYPRKWSLWHLYERKGLDKHWDNFIKDPSLKKTYDDLHLKSYSYLRKALQGDPEMGHLFGSAHSIADFENYSGVSFKYKVIHPQHLSGGEPPFETSSDWENRIMPLKEMMIAMDLNVNDIPERDDYTFWYFGFHDKLDIEMFREDIKSNTETFKKHPVHFQKKVLLRETPATYSIWPYCKEKGWLTRLKYRFDPKFVQ